MRVQKNNGGFSFIELIICIALSIILVGLLAQSTLSTRQKSKEKVYLLEAADIYRAMNLFLIDTEERNDYDVREILQDIGLPLDEKDHILKPYISGEVTKGASIIAADMVAYPLAFVEIQYWVDGYIIKVEANGKATIKSYPNKGNSSDIMGDRMKGKRLQ